MNAAYANAEAFGPYNSAWVEQQALDARNKLGDPLALLAGNIYQTERDWMNKAAGLVPSIQQAGYVPGQVVKGVGDFGQQQTQRYTDATMNAMLDNSNYPWSQLYSSNRVNATSAN